MSKSKRNEQIEGLRGLSIFMIVIFHIIYRYNQIYHPEMVTTQLAYIMSWWGEFGTLFFIYISIWNIKPTEKIGKYMLKRYFRLYPSYLLSILIIYLLSHFLPLGQRSVNFSVFLQNLTMLNGFWGNEYVDGAHWYITMLLSASFTIVLIETKCRNNKFKQLFFFFWIIVGLLLRVFDTPYFFHSIFTVGYIGSITFISSIRRITNEYEKEKKIIFNLSFFVEILLIILSMGYMMSLRGVRYCVMMVITGFLYLLCVYKKMNLFNNKILQWIGLVSYPLYLIHQNVSYMLQNMLYNKFGAQNHYMYYFIAVIISFALGTLIYYFWDRIITGKIKQIEKRGKQ